ncbi:hypothetical protein E2C01_100199 [Portunus trituberculatus]|uniref:Uncharacterized protein n=1 Tax=Portunus trituberculatus TaxID=210409 RepID=A0A5B7KCD8_PORTR|nr:hypothetical protein [Portunus trituberculatus]
MTGKEEEEEEEEEEVEEEEEGERREGRKEEGGARIDKTQASISRNERKKGGVETDDEGITQVMRGWDTVRERRSETSAGDMRKDEEEGKRKKEDDDDDDMIEEDNDVI